jgi:hypothetical protein
MKKFSQLSAPKPPGSVFAMGFRVMSVAATGGRGHVCVTWNRVSAFLQPSRLQMLTSPIHRGTPHLRLRHRRQTTTLRLGDVCV